MPIAGQLLHEVGNLRKEAVIALGEIGDPAAIPALEAAGSDPDPDVRKLSKLALTSLQLNSRGQA
jgi:HEAT repeat protein